MKLYKAQLRLLSPLGTPLAADTLFGHICWSMAYREGDEKLAKFLRRMDSDAPPLLLSDPFPAGNLPVPVLPLQHNANDEKDRDRYKDLKKIRYISISRLAECCKALNSTAILEHLSQQIDGKQNEKLFLSPHNHVNRLGGGTVEGGVFFTEDIYPDSGNSLYDIYINSDEYDASQLKMILTDALAGGYGRDKSIGRGVIEVGVVEQAKLPDAENHNAVMLLGPCVPAQTDPTKGFWSIKAKTGRLGGHWAISEFPFKKTIMMLQAGSILQTDKPNPFYGRIVHNVHPELPKVVHYGLAMVLRVRLQHDIMEAA